MSVHFEEFDLRYELATVAKELEYQLPLLDARRAGAELYGAPRLLITELFDPNENTLSRILGDLFDPRGVHGQGMLFLNELLSALKLPSVRVRDAVRVTREALTEERRRIDIVIETPSVLMGIENKPWARQQPNQLAAYYDELKRRAGNRQVVLLFVSDQEAKSAQGKVVRMPLYAAEGDLSLHGVLTAASTSIRATRTQILVEDLVRWISQQFGEVLVNDDTDEPYVQAVLAEFEFSASRKRAMAAILLTQSKLHARVLDEIGDFLLRELREKVAKDFVLETEKSLWESLNERYSTWGLRREMWPTNCLIGLESDRNGRREVYFGVRAPDPRSGDVKAYPGAECVARADLEGIGQLVTDGQTTDWWPWWKSAETRYWGPEFAGRVVIEAPNGEVGSHPEIQELARSFVQLATAVNEAVSARS